MGSIQGRTGWFRHSIAFAAAAVVAGFQLFSSPVFAGYELPPGERITNLPAIPRNMPAILIASSSNGFESSGPISQPRKESRPFWCFMTRHCATSPALVRGRLMN